MVMITANGDDHG